MLVGWDFDLFGFDLKGKLFDRISCFFLCLQFNSTSNLVIIFNFYFLDQSFRVFRWHQSTKIEHSLIHKEYIRFDQTFNSTRLMLTLHDYLFLENTLEIFSVDSWNARFCH